MIRTSLVMGDKVDYTVPSVGGNLMKSVITGSNFRNSPFFHHRLSWLLSLHPDVTFLGSFLTKMLALFSLS